MIDRNLRRQIYKAAAHIYVMLKQLKSGELDICSTLFAIPDD